MIQLSEKKELSIWKQLDLISRLIYNVDVNYEYPSNVIEPQSELLQNMIDNPIESIIDFEDPDF